jgi:signal transduction histidine kinase
VAIENVRLARQERRLAVLEERERIAMDLHDGTIQSIYAVGLTLDYTRLLLEQNPAQVQERIGMAIDELNGVIRDIRSYILDLQPARMHSNDLEQAMNRLAREFKANTLIDVELSVEQGVSAKLSREQSTTFFHIAQEALANIAKHAQASRVWLNVRSLDDDLILQVIDNGLGFDLHDVQTRLGHGLSNMEERTRLVGGEFEVVSEPGEGTTITVRIANHNDVQAEQRQDLHKRQKT